MTADRTTGTGPVFERLLGLHPKIIDLSLGRIEKLLAKLGHPEREIPPVIHVAGTNGKGSTVATARAILEAAGYRVHVYTSPHLVRFNERIRLGGALIADGMLTALLEEVEARNGGDPITFFEITTAAAFLAFSRHPADVTLLEVGLGGRFDATNVIPEPLMTAITPVAYDHQQYLGDTLELIAGEKAGIIKPGVPVAVAPQLRAADETIRHEARLRKAPLIAFGRDWLADPEPAGGFSYRDSRGRLELPSPALEGRHQILNAGLAIAVLRHQDRLPVSEAAIRAGLGWVRWPARLQRIETGALPSLLPEGSELWLDGGHNPAGGRAVAPKFRDMAESGTPVYLISGMLETKDAAGFFTPFAGYAKEVIAVPVPDAREARKPGSVAAAASDAGIRARMAKDVPSALRMIAAGHSSGKPPAVLIAGSLYLAGHVLELSGLVPE